MCNKHFGLLFLAVFAIPAILSAQQEMKKATTSTWAIKGDYVDACSCDRVCSCEFGVAMEGCEGIGAFRVKEGHYGETSLNGTTVALYIKPGVEHALYVDESVTEPQRDALLKILAERFGEEGGTQLGVKTAKISFAYAAAKASVEIPNVMAMKADRAKGMDGKKPIVLTNSFNPLAFKVMSGTATQNEYKDFGRQFKYEGHNSWFGSIDLKGK
jgi:hypothetical protein